MLSEGGSLRVKNTRPGESGRPQIRQSNTMRPSFGPTPPKLANRAAMTATAGSRLFMKGL
jgi:hypothetical protein